MNGENGATPCSGFDGAIDCRDRSDHFAVAAIFDLFAVLIAKTADTTESSLDQLVPPLSQLIRQCHD